VLVFEIFLCGEGNCPGGGNAPREYVRGRNVLHSQQVLFGLVSTVQCRQSRWILKGPFIATQLNSTELNSASS